MSGSRNLPPRDLKLRLHQRLYHSANQRQLEIMIRCYTRRWSNQSAWLIKLNQNFFRTFYSSTCSLVQDLSGLLQVEVKNETYQKYTSMQFENVDMVGMLSIINRRWIVSNRHDYSQCNQMESTQYCRQTDNNSPGSVKTADFDQMSIVLSHCRCTTRTVCAVTFSRPPAACSY